MTAELAERSIAELEADLELALAALDATRRAEQAASRDVDAAREARALERITLKAKLLTQRGLADRQEQTAMAEAKVRGVTRLLQDARDRKAAERSRAEQARHKALRAAGAGLVGQLHDVLARFLADLDEFEDEFRRFNSQGGLPSLYRLRPPSDYSLLTDRLIGSAQQLLNAYPPAPKAPVKHEEEPSDV